MLGLSWWLFEREVTSDYAEWFKSMPAASQRGSEAGANGRSDENRAITDLHYPSYPGEHELFAKPGPDPSVAGTAFLRIPI